MENVIMRLYNHIQGEYNLKFALCALTTKEIDRKKVIKQYFLTTFPPSLLSSLPIYNITFSNIKNVAIIKNYLISLFFKRDLGEK